MKTKLVFLQNLQDTYAKWTGLAVFICSLNGNLLTSISWGNRVTERLYKKFVTKEKLETFIKPLDSVNRTILLDTEFGCKVIISPVKNNGKVMYFIISGFIVDERADEIIKKVDQIKDFTDTIASYVAMFEETTSTKKHLKLVTENTESISNETSTIDSILEMGIFIDEVDFIGFASKLNEDVFKTEKSIGWYYDALKSYSFSVGEGLLGYSLASKRPQLYTNITSDPRNSVFQKKGMEVVSLFCYPIIQNDNIIGLLFGGSTENEITNGSVYDRLSSCASIMTNHLLVQSLRYENVDQLIELSTFKEIFKVLTTVKDLKKILFILIDIGMRMKKVDFSSIVYRHKPKCDRVEIISRGMSDSEITDYSDVVAKKYFTVDSESKKWNEPSMGETSWGASIMEFPIIFDKSRHGILTIGFGSEVDMKNYQNIIMTLATAGGIAIHFLSENEEGRNKHVFFELIQKVLKIFRPEKYELAKLLKKTITEFLQPINMEDLLVVEKIAFFSVCSHDLVESMGDDKELFLLMKQFYKVLEKSSEGNRLIESIAVVWTYYMNDRSIGSIFELELINKDIQDQFLIFYKRRTTAERKIQVTISKSVEQPTKNQFWVDLSAEFGLTEREKDVLNEVLKGLSNKEVAEVLYISNHTVKNHMTNIFTKLDVLDRSQAIAKIYQMGGNPT